MSQLRNPVATIILAVALLYCATSALADEHEGPNQGRVSVSIGFDVTTQYMFRGIFQDDQGFIIQPWGEVGFNLHAGAADEH